MRAVRPLAYRYARASAGSGSALASANSTAPADTSSTSASTRGPCLGGQPRALDVHRVAGPAPGHLVGRAVVEAYRVLEGVVGVEAVGAGLDQLGAAAGAHPVDGGARGVAYRLGSWPSTTAAGMPKAAARPGMLPATAPATGIVVA